VNHHIVYPEVEAQTILYRLSETVESSCRY